MSQRLSGARALALSALALTLASCAGPRVREVRTNALPAPAGASPNVTQYALQAHADFVIASAEAYAEAPIEEEAWLMSGADGQGQYWFTYLRFDLTPVPQSARCAETTLTLPWSDAATLVSDETSGEFLAVPVDATPADFGWIDPPRGARTPAARFFANIGLPTRANLTDHTNALLERGEATMALLIVPADPTHSFRQLWRSTESAGSTRHSTSDVPTLSCTVGAPPPARSAAERDQLLLAP